MHVVHQIMDFDAHAVDGFFHSIAFFGVHFGGLGNQAAHVITCADEAAFVTTSPFDRFCTAWIVNRSKASDTGIYSC